MLLALLLLAPRPSLLAAQAPQRFDRGRFTVVAYPDDWRLARSLLDAATRDDSFPGLPRPSARALIAIAPDMRRFREWVGPGAPEWGAAIAFPESQRIVMQGQHAGSDAGDPLAVLRHELAHLALHEYMGELPPRWFDEGYASYAAHEWSRDDALATNVALALRGMPSLDQLDERFEEGSARAQEGYALSYRVVADLAALDPQRGLAVFFREWKRTFSLDQAVRGAYGLTLAQFEQRWQTETRRRYGALALMSEFVVGTLFLVVLVAPLYLARRRRDRERMAALVAADRAAEAESAALAAMLGEASPPVVGPAPGEEP